MTVKNEVEYLDLQATELKTPTFFGRVSKIILDLIKSNWKVLIFLVIGNITTFYLYKKLKSKINN